MLVSEMSNRLKEFLHKIDRSNLDHTNRYEIEDELQKLRDEFIELKDLESANLSQLEMEVFSFSKRIENNNVKLSYNFKGQYKNEKNEELPYEWPDSTKYTKEQFDYVLKRFKESKNNFTKSEYGLVIILAEKSPYKDNETVSELLESLLALSETYYNKLINKEQIEKHYVIYYVNLIEYIFYISIQRNQSNRNIKLIFDTVVDHVYNTICNSVFIEYYPKVISSFVKLINENLKIYKNFDLSQILNSLWVSTSFLMNKNAFSGISMANMGDLLESKVSGKRNTKWLKFIGEKYEDLGKDAIEREDPVAVSYIEDAIKAFKSIKEDEKISELEKLFFDLKSKYSGQEFTTEFPNFKERLEELKKFINIATENDILGILITTPMLPDINIIMEEYKKAYEYAPLTSMITKSVVDKMGNTIAEYNYEDKEAIDYYNFVQSYDFYFQEALQEIRYLFIESIKANKINYDIIINSINNSWLGEKINRTYNGRLHEIEIVKVITSSIKRIFDEIHLAIEDKNHEIDIVMSVDSLTLKFDYIFRHFCEKLGIQTYKDKNREKKLKEERTINALLEDSKIKDIFENANLEGDLFLFKFILTEKASHWNLRNRVAHGLMDFDEYGIDHGILLLILILKISSYRFK